MGVSRRSVACLTVVTVIVVIAVVVSCLVVLTIDWDWKLGEEETATSDTKSTWRPTPDQNVIEQYVRTHDDSYSFSVLHDLTQRDRVGSYTSYVLNMTSQQWLTVNETDRPLWWHYMIVTVPDVIRYNDTGLLFVSAGDNTDRLPNPSRDTESRIVSHMATEIGLVSAVIRQVPNQPIVFEDDVKRKQRTGPGLLAYTIREVIEGHGKDYNWLLLCPMVKSIVRGLDTVTNFTNGAVTRFYLSGASERGWATWLTAAVDERVVGIAPLVFGDLNFAKAMKHHHRTLNGYSWAIGEFWGQNLTHYLDDPVGGSVFSILDPLSYRHLLSLPKYIILSSNDEQYMPDSTRLFYEQLTAPVFLRIYPNSDNTLLGSWHRVASDCIGFISTVEEKRDLPDVRWNVTEGNQTTIINVKSNMVPVSVSTWSADTNSSTRRDFRLRTASAGNLTVIKNQRILFKKIPTESLGPKAFRVVIQKPEHGWTGAFLEVVFDAPRGAHFTITTEMTIVPDTYPVDECTGANCHGNLV